MFKKNYFLIISVLLHLIVIYVLAQSVMFPAKTDSPIKKSDTIHATLIFDFPLPSPPPTQKSAEAIEEALTEPVLQEEKPLVTEIPQENPIQPILEPEVQAPEIRHQLKTLPQSPQEEQKKEVQEEPEQNTKENDISSIEENSKSVTTTTNLEIGAPVTSMARRHLNNFQQRQQNSIAEQASRRYQQRKNSPIIDDEIKDRFKTEDEKFRDKLKVRADCSSTSKKTTAVLMGFLGGSVDCSKPPAIKGFIQNRIHKKSVSSGQPRHKEQQRPQSIVIQKQP